MEIGPACGACGTPLARGLCPRCLLNVGLATEPGEVAALSDTAPPLARLGDFELFEEIGRGGMGIVYRARQVSLDRTVAVKVLPFGGLGSADATLRLRAEAVSAGSLRHSHIVAVHEVGLHQGQHFLAMDYVAGPSLARVLRDGPLAARRAAALLRQVALAVQHAHERGIIHRDIKPSNILLDAVDDEPRITDFGLAKNLRSDTHLTLSGQTLGSPNYIPPEQVRSGIGETDAGEKGRKSAGENDAAPTTRSHAHPLPSSSARITFASDVYALGAVLYHALTGRPPFQGENIADVLRQVMDDEPIAPRRLAPSIPPDLETICLKCLEKEPARRYATAQALADDLGCFLDGRPVLARPVTPWERSWRWCQRKPVVASLGAATLLLIFVIALGSSLALRRIAVEQDVTRSNLYAADMAVAQEVIAAGEFGLGRRLLEAHVPHRAEADLRGFEWRHLWHRSRSQESATLQGAGEYVVHLSVSADGRWLAGGGGIWKIPPPQSPGGPPTRPHYLLPAGYDALAFASDGELLIRSARGDLKHWNPLTRQEEGLLTGEHVLAVAFSATGRWLATGSRTALRLWDTITWQQVASNTVPRFDSDLLKELAFSPDEQWLITSTGGPFSGISVLAFWSVPTLAALPGPEVNVPDITSLAFAPERAEFYTGSANGTLRVWDRATRQEIQERRVTRSHRSWISGIVPLKDSGRLVTASADRTIHISEPTGERTAIALHGHSDEIWALAVSPDGLTVASAERRGKGTIKLWSIPSAKAQDRTDVLADNGARMQPIGLSADGQMLATLTATGLRFWNLGTALLEEVPSLRWDHRLGNLPVDPSSGRGFVAVSSDLRHFAVAIANRPIELWDLPDHSPTRLGVSGPLAFPAFSPDGTLLVASTAINQVTVWDAATKEQRAVLTLPFPLQDESALLTFSGDGRWLAISLDNGHILIWDVARGAVKKMISAPPRLVHALSWDGGVLATGSEDNLVRLFDVGTGRELGAPLEGHVSGVLSLAFSPDGKSLFSGADDSRLWNLATRRTVASHLHLSSVIAGLFSSDGRILVTGEFGQTIRLWRAPTFSEIATEATTPQAER